MGTVYRHLSTRGDLVIAVDRYQVEACAEAGPALLASCDSPHQALVRWIDLFVDFLVTKHGLDAAMQSDRAGFDGLHAWFIDRLRPLCAELIDAARASGEIEAGTDAFDLMFAVGNLCIGVEAGVGYDARRMVACSSAAWAAVDDQKARQATAERPDFPRPPSCSATWEGQIADRGGVLRPASATLGPPSM